MKDDELHIWRYNLDELDYHSEKKSPVLSKEEQKRYSSYLNESDKIRYICNHRFVRQVLSEYLNIPSSQIEFSYAHRGKPYVKNSGLFFNYSYRANFCILGITKSAEVGIDIEKIKPLQDIPTFTEFCFSKKEKEIIFNSDKDRFQDTLFTFWTFKEAIIKSLGIGLSADLTQIDLSSFYHSEVNALSYDNDNIYTMKNIEAPEGFKAAFAIKGKLSNYLEFN